MFPLWVRLVMIAVGDGTRRAIDIIYRRWKRRIERCDIDDEADEMV